MVSCSQFLSGFTNVTSIISERVTRAVTPGNDKQPSTDILSSPDVFVIPGLPL